MLKLPGELEFLLQALEQGRVNGSTYRGACACLAGTLAHARGIEDYTGTCITNGGVVFKTDSSSKRELFFSGISEGDTPATNQLSALAHKWTKEAIQIRDTCRTIEQTPPTELHARLMHVAQQVRGELHFLGHLKPEECEPGYSLLTTGRQLAQRSLDHLEAAAHLIKQANNETQVPST